MAIKVTGCHRWAVSSGKSPTPLGLSSLLSQGCHEAAVSKEWTVLGLAGAGRPERPLRVVTEGHDVSVDEAGVCTGGGARREAQPGHSGAAARAGDSGRHFRCVLAETKAMGIYEERRGEPLHQEKKGITIGADNRVMLIILKTVLNFQSSSHNICFLDLFDNSFF